VDDQGHGTHVAGIAAGNANVPMESTAGYIGTHSGTAPSAKLAIYKVVWPAKDGSLGFVTDNSLIAAIDAAVIDGVDIINLSLGHADTSPPVEKSVLAAASAGIFIAAGAGNSALKPGDSSIENVSPWVTTVAASTRGDREGHISVERTTYSEPRTFVAKLSPDFVDPGPRPIISRSMDTVKEIYCAPGALGRTKHEASKFQGTIVVCSAHDYDNFSALQMSQEVARVKGSGMIVLNYERKYPITSPTAVPTVFLGKNQSRLWYRSYETILSLEGKGLPAVAMTVRDGAGTNRIAEWSGRGWNKEANGNILKPDLAAPGTDIISSYIGGPSRAFAYRGGTSQSTPIVAGLGAKYLQANPFALPSEVKSAMMTTARPIASRTSSANEGVLAEGAGEIASDDMMSPGLLYLDYPAAWRDYAAGSSRGKGKELNLPAISIGDLAGIETVKRTVTALKPGTWNVETPAIPGYKTRIYPETLNFNESSQSLDYYVEFTRTSAETDVFYQGDIVWSDGGPISVRIPVAIRSKDDYEITLGEGKDSFGPEHHLVRASGEAGRTESRVTSGKGGNVHPTTSGFVAGHSKTGELKVGKSHSRMVSIKSGTEYVFLDLSSTDSESRLGLSFYTSTPEGVPKKKVIAATVAAAEQQLVTEAPVPGNYVIKVTNMGTSPTPFSLNWYAKVGVEKTGKSMIGKAVVRTGDPILKPNQSTLMTFDWQDLPNKGLYVAQVRYGYFDSYTYILVDARTASGPPKDQAPPRTAEKQDGASREEEAGKPEAPGEGEPAPGVTAPTKGADGAESEAPAEGEMPWRDDGEEGAGGAGSDRLAGARVLALGASQWGDTTPVNVRWPSSDFQRIRGHGVSGATDFTVQSAEPVEFLPVTWVSGTSTRGAVAAGEGHEFTVSVPGGSGFMYLDFENALPDGTALADVAVAVFRVQADGTLKKVDSLAGAGSALVLHNPMRGDYRVRVANTTETVASTVTMTSYVMDPTAKKPNPRPWEKKTSDVDIVVDDDADYSAGPVPMTAVWSDVPENGRYIGQLYNPGANSADDNTFIEVSTHPGDTPDTTTDKDKPPTP
jgi:subtilisin family serine protease